MLATIRYHSRRKLPVLLLVFLLCVQSLGFASHGQRIKAPAQTEVAEQAMPPCHDMPEMQAAATQDTSDHSMPCCDDGQCADAQCMMPAGTHFALALQDYFVAHTSDVLIPGTRSIHSLKASPPIRPPIA
jgi:hypothetical protein